MKNNKSKFPILMVVIVAGYYNTVQSQPSEITDIITVDASKNLGEMPEVFRAGIWLNRIGDDSYITDKFLSENVLGTVQAHYPFAEFLRKSISFEDYKQRLQNAFSVGTENRKIIEEIKKSGQTFVIGHFPSPMPVWLSSSNDERKYSESWRTVRMQSPPICYDYECEIDGKKIVGWAGIVDFTLRFLRDDLGMHKLAYYHGHEQNQDWIGEEEEFYKLYLYTVIGVKGVDENIRVGGAGVWGWNAKRSKCISKHYNEVGLEYCNDIENWSIDNWEEPMSKNFLDYANLNNIDVDFVNYHMFGYPAFSGEYLEAVQTMKEWLRVNGFSESTLLYPADWAYWSGRLSRSMGNPYGYPFDQIDSEENSAYVLSTVFIMDQAGIKWHSHDFDVSHPPRENERVFDSRGSEFIGDWPIFTRSQIIKPVYNSFKALSILNGKQEDQIPDRLQVEFHEDGFIRVVSSQTKDERRIRVLLSNFVPSGIMLNRYALNILDNCAYGKGYAEDEWRIIKESVKETAVDNPRNGGEAFLEYLKRIVMMTDFPDGFDDNQIKQDIFGCLADAESELQIADNMQTTPKQITLNINNLPFSGKAQVTTYTIDRDHSNSCRYNKKTEEAPSDTECGINGAVDRAVRNANDEAAAIALAEATDYLKENGYTDEQVNTISSQLVQPCIGSGGFVTCVNSRIDFTCSEYPTIDCDSLKQDLTDAYSVYQGVFADLFYSGEYQGQTTSVWIDRINNDPNIALEGSKQIKDIRIENHQMSEDMTMQPYGVVLFEVCSASANDGRRPATRRGGPRRWLP